MAGKIRLRGVMRMRRVRWAVAGLFLCLLVPTLSAQNPQDLLKTFTRNFAIASLDVKIQIIRDAGTTGYKELGPLYVDAVSYVLNNYALLQSDQRLRQLGALAVDQLKAIQYREARFPVWKLFETDSESGLRVSCLGALGVLGKGDPEIIQYLNLWLETQNTVFQTGKVPDVYVVYAAVQALGELGDPSSFPVLFSTMARGYTDDITQRARENLFRLGGSLKQNILGVLGNSPLPEKRLALGMALDTDRLSEQEKAEVAQFALDVGLHTALPDNPSRQIARDLRYTAVQALTARKWSAATALVIEHFDTVLQEYDRGLSDKTRLLEAINCLGSMGTHEAAVRLTQYLVLLNSYTEKLQEYDGRIVLAVVENIGLLADKVAFDDLMYSQYLNYSGEIKAAVRKALERLRW
jgi:hypothetical protein